MKKYVKTAIGSVADSPIVSNKKSTVPVVVSAMFIAFRKHSVC